jgi:colicin import membrane protein
LEEARAAQAVKEKAQKEAVEVARKLATVESERKAAADKARVDAVRAETMANVENNRQKRESKRFKAPVDTTTQIKAETATEPSKTKALQTIQEAKAIISTLQKKKVSDMSDEERATRKKEGERIAQAANDLKETERKAKAAAKAAKERNDKEAREQKLLEKQQKNEEIVRKDKEAKAAAALNAKAVEGSAQKTPRPTSAKKRK